MTKELSVLVRSLLLIAIVVSLCVFFVHMYIGSQT
jgi:hypothetical protein